MTFLRDKGKIQQLYVSPESEYAAKGKQVWVVEYELLVKVDGRNLVYQALWPVSQQGPDAMPVEQNIYAESQTSISATFKAGTA